MGDPNRVGVRALDDLTLDVELEGPTGYLLQLLTHNITFPVPRHIVQALGTAWTHPDHIVTNGPFRLLARERSASMVLERCPAYHGRFTGNVGRVELILLAGDMGRSFQMYEEDGLDVLMLSFLPPAEQDRARQRHAGEYRSVLSLGTDYVAFDASRPPFDDPRVRRAFTLATDRETLANVALRGHEYPAMGGYVPPGMPGHSPGIGLPYDPEEARRLLAEAGYPGRRGFPALDAWGRATPNYVSAAESLRAQWRETLGVEVVWKTMDLAEYIDRLARERPHMWDMGWRADYPDPDSFLRVSDAWFGWRNEAYEKLVEGARRVMNQEERMRIYRQADRILVEEAPILPRTYSRRHRLVKPWMRRYPMSPMGDWFWKDAVIDPH
jgi:ABC-type oligopeptide transport system substrate-binding subunit